MVNFNFWAKNAVIRAIKTFAQTLVALIGTGVVAFGEIDWLFNLSAAGVAGVLSILTSIAGLPEVELEEDLAITEAALEEALNNAKHVRQE